MSGLDQGFSPSPILAKRRLFLLGLLGIPVAAGAAPAAAEGPLYRRGFSAFQNKGLEERVQELADREEIKELISRYAHCIAHGVSVADLFTDDGAFIVRVPGRPIQEVRGRAALDRLYATVKPDDPHPMPMIHNHLLSISGDDAVGMCSNELRITEKGQSIIASGYYDDRLRREGGRWKFVVRDATFFHWVPIQQGWAKPAK
jgi:hypothetical protein